MYKSELQTILDSFTPIRLDEMDEVILMNRVETKYVFSSGQLPELLSQLTDSYRVLEIDNIRMFPYSTVYLDTSDLLFYTQQIRGKLNRHKIRFRKYESTGLSFLEIKKKTNKSRTVKWRIENSLVSDFPDENGASFIRNYLPDCLPDLRPVLNNGFTRITLVGKECRERVTLDFNLSFSCPESEITRFPFLAVAEVKRRNNACFSSFGKTIKQLGIHPNRFSKYCIGSALVKDMPKKNILKRNLLLINKLENEYIKSTGN